MDLGNIVGKAEELAKDHAEQVEQGLDKGAEFAKGKVEGHDDQIDAAVDKVKGLLD